MRLVHGCDSKPGWFLVSGSAPLCLVGKVRWFVLCLVVLLPVGYRQICGFVMMFDHRRSVRCSWLGRFYVLPRQRASSRLVVVIQLASADAG